MKKRILAVVLTLALLFTHITVVPVAASFVSGNYTYALSDDNTVSITQIKTRPGGVLTIPETLDGYPVVEISSNVFEYSFNLTTVIIPEGVKVIGPKAFYKCTSLTNIVLPDSLTEIGEDAFLDSGYYSNAANWENSALYIEDCLVDVKQDEIKGAYAIKEGTRVIAEYAFDSCDALTDIQMPDSVVAIGQGAFRHCDGLTDVTLPKSLTEISDNLFYYCVNLQNITIPDGVKSIGYSSFYSCSSLTSVVIPDSVTEIEIGAFVYCVNLTDIELPDSVTKMSGAIFNETAFYKDASNWEDSVLYLGNHLLKATSGVSANYRVKPGTVCIDGGAFGELTHLKSVTIPDSVVAIGESAFSGCTAMKSIKLPEGLRYLGNSAFRTTGISVITIPGSVTSLEDEVFYECTALQKVLLQDGVEKIGNYTFAFANQLTEVSLPDSLQTIGDAAFWYCSNLQRITIPAGVNKISSSAFVACEKLTDIMVVPENTAYTSENGVLLSKDMKTMVFYPSGKRNTSYEIPNGVTVIEKQAFYYCTSLTEVTIPKSVQEIKTSAFYGCSNLKKVVIPEGVTQIEESAFFDCTSLKEVILPASIGTLKLYAFYGCDEITKVGYTGSQKDWAGITFEYGNNAIKNASISYNYIVLPFTDVAQDQWYCATIKEACDLGLMYGATDTLFKPNVPMTRGMMAAVLHRMAGSPVVVFQGRFSDVAAVDWYAIPVSWAASKGVINGYNSGRFAPNDNVTREQVATMLCNYAKFAGKYTKASDTVLEKFNDEQKISSYAVESMQWAVANGLISGKDNGIRLDPQGTATRAECTKMLLQAYKLINP